MPVRVGMRPSQEIIGSVPVLVVLVMHVCMVVLK